MVVGTLQVKVIVLKKAHNAPEMCPRGLFVYLRDARASTLSVLSLAIDEGGEGNRSVSVTGFEGMNMRPYRDVGPEAVEHTMRHHQRSQGLSPGDSALFRC